jgi:acyl carrier protein
MIITGGENVAPDEIDAVLLRHPSVLEAATVGVDDPVWGQRVVSAVTLAPGAVGNINEAGLIDHCRESLSGPRVPRSIVVLPEIPRTGPSKVDANAVVAALTAVTLDGDDLEAAVRRLAGRVFGADADADAETLDLHATPGDTEGWDSIAHMELVTLAEEAWEIELSNADVIGIDSLHDLVQCIRQHRE